ncbi:MAG: hypothetical protein LC802_12465 [Acidobacteria bacterium]|nr:hypothetical protein [Acidobacteriota bacterium]
MRLKGSENGDEGNSSFELPDSVLEDLKPGVEHGEDDDDATDNHAHQTEVHHRFRRRDKTDIPQESLAERIRKAAEGV